MKRFISTLFILIFATSALFSQESSNIVSDTTDVMGAIRDAIASSLNHELEEDLSSRYELYPTTNMWNFLKLDTQTGAVWQVQFTINKGEEYSFQERICYPFIYFQKTFNGRFKLYPTQNNYNFLLLDTLEGQVYQIQWSLDSSYTQGLIREIK